MEQSKAKILAVYGRRKRRLSFQPRRSVDRFQLNSTSQLARIRVAIESKLRDRQSALVEIEIAIPRAMA
jgi:hypothetical protein